MLRFIRMSMTLSVLIAATLAAGLLTTLPAHAQIAAARQLTTASPQAEPARLCGTNSSRSRRCFFGNRECLKNGKSQADCDRALSICRSCIDGMVACARQAANSCAVCTERYSSCMAPWVALID